MKKRMVSGPRYLVVSQDERYVQLKARSRRLILVVGCVFAGWYLLYVVACEFARGLLAYRLFGHFNIALVFGVLQFASTFVIATRCAHFSREVIDPLAAQVVTDAERRVRAGDHA